MFKKLFVAIFLLNQQLLSSVINAENVVVKAYQSVNNVMTYPEQNAQQSFPSVGISFSGGGSRAYTCSFGYLAAFHKLGLIEQIGYIAGISGGSWATSVYSYSQLNVSDDVLLGKLDENPADITYDNLAIMDESCARKNTNMDYNALFKELILSNPTKTAYDLWQSSISLGMYIFYFLLLLF